MNALILCYDTSVWGTVPELFTAVVGLATFIMVVHTFSEQQKLTRLDLERHINQQDLKLELDAFVGTVNHDSDNYSCTVKLMLKPVNGSCMLQGIEFITYAKHWAIEREPKIKKKTYVAKNHTVTVSVSFWIPTIKYYKKVSQQNDRATVIELYFSDLLKNEFKQKFYFYMPQPNSDSSALIAKAGPPRYLVDENLDEDF